MGPKVSTLVPFLCCMRLQGREALGGSIRTRILWGEREEYFYRRFFTKCLYNNNAIQQGRIYSQIYSFLFVPTNTQREGISRSGTRVLVSFCCQR